MKSFILKTGRNKYHRVMVCDLEYIQAHKGRTIVCYKGETLNTAFPFKDLLNSLNGQIFQCHRSFAVNLDAVTDFTNDSITLPSKTLALGVNYKNDFKKRMFERSPLFHIKQEEV